MVVGGGVMGLSTARALVLASSAGNANLHVTLVDAGHSIARVGEMRATRSLEVSRLFTRLW